MNKAVPVSSGLASGRGASLTIRVAVVEDDAACRSAFAEAIGACADMRLVWQAASLAEAQTLLSSSRLDVLVVDLGLPDGSGLSLIGWMRAAQPACAVMVSTVFGDDAHVLSAVEAGALGYLLKDVTPARLMDEIRSLHAGGSPINPMVARKLLQRPALTRQEGTGADGKASEGDEVLALSQRETAVLRLVARGHSLEEVALRMGVSRHTVRTFVRRIYQKLQVSNRMEAVQVALQQGLLKNS